MDEVISISFFIILFMLTFLAVSVFLDGHFFALKKTAKIVILSMCIGIILYETVLFRPQKSTISYELELFWSYKLAISGKGYYAWEIIDNILLYVPYGFMLPAVFKKLKAWHLILLIVALSTVTELIQLVGRIGLFEFDDIFDNTLGGVTGMVLYFLIQRAKTRLKH